MLKTQSKEKLVNVNFKVTEKERKEIEERAKKFAGGNISAWMRYAASKLSPLKKDLAK